MNFSKFFNPAGIDSGDVQYIKFWLQQNAGICTISGAELKEFLQYAEEMVGGIYNKNNVNLPNLMELAEDERTCKKISREIAADKKFRQEMAEMAEIR